jgi:hypothetical protein
MILAYIIVGILAALSGIALVATGIRRGPDAQPKNMVMLIGGMMLTAFGIVLAGFAIVYTNAAPIDLNAGATR